MPFGQALSSVALAKEDRHRRWSRLPACRAALSAALSAVALAEAEALAEAGLPSRSSAKAGFMGATAQGAQESKMLQALDVNKAVILHDMAGDTQILRPKASRTRMTVAIVGLPPGENAR